MIDEEGQQNHAPKRARVRVGTSIATVATVLAIVLYRSSGGASVFVQPALATLIGLALVAGLSALESFYPEPPVRRGAAFAAAQGNLVKLWLGCFLALEAAFLLSNLTNGLERSANEHALKSREVSFAGKLTFVEGSRRHDIDVLGRGVFQATDQKRDGGGGAAGIPANK